MPTYRNMNYTAVKYAHTTFYPREDTPVSFFVPHEDLNFSLVSNSPSVSSPVLFCGTVTDATVEIPHAVNITLSAVSSGGATLYLADDTDGIRIDHMTGFQITARWREIGRVRVAGTAQIVVERG